MEVNKVVLGKMEEKLKEYPDNFFDSMVTDAPYGFGKEPNIIQVMKDWVEKGVHEIESKSGGFMGKKWDSFVPQPIQFKEAFRVLKPGAHAFVACGTRTQDWMTASLRFAGFEIRDVITWHYGSGFPKSLDISKAIDKSAGSEREVIDIVPARMPQAQATNWGNPGIDNFRDERRGTVDMNITEPATDEAKEWEGWGTALKPATEFWTLCRKPLSENTVAENVLKWGTGGINIDACRIGEREKEQFTGSKNGTVNAYGNYFYDKSSVPLPSGRFPANLILDEFMAAELDKQSGVLTSGHMDTVSKGKNYGIYGKYNGKEVYAEGDSGGASRFFYVAKPSQYERSKGLFKREAIKVNDGRKIDADNAYQRGKTERTNSHPTVKPIELMRYLVKMITRKGGVCIDPFCGSGSTLIACKMEEINYVGIDTEPEYCEISEARIKAWHLQTDLFNE